MLPEIGATELLVIAVVALIVVGPKDLPALLRKLGQFTAKLRGMAAEFRSSFDEMARQSELDDLRKEVEAMRSGQQAVAASLSAPLHDTYEDLNRGLSPDPAYVPYATGEPGADFDGMPAEPEPAPKPKRTRAPKAAATSVAPKPRTRNIVEGGPRRGKIVEGGS